MLITAEVAELLIHFGVSALSRQLCITNIPGGEKRWGSGASNKSEGP